MLVLENPVEDKELLAASVRVGREMRVRRVADDRCSARDLLADPVEHAAFNTGHWRGRPGQLSRMHYRALGKICVEFHCVLLGRANVDQRVALGHNVSRRLILPQRTRSTQRVNIVN